MSEKKGKKKPRVKVTVIVQIATNNKGQREIKKKYLKQE